MIIGRRLPNATYLNLELDLSKVTKTDGDTPQEAHREVKRYKCHSAFTQARS